MSAIDLIAEFHTLYERLGELRPTNYAVWTEQADRERCLELRQVILRLSEISDELTEERIAQKT